MTEKFVPENFKDEYNRRLKKAIKAKVAGESYVIKKEAKAPSNVINLMDALKESLSKAPKKRLKNEA